MERLRAATDELDQVEVKPGASVSPWETLDLLFDPARNLSPGTIGMLEEFAKQLDRKGVLSTAQIMTMENIAFGDPTVKALEHACPECGAAKGDLCIGKRQARIKGPHDGRLSLLPQTKSVVLQRRDRARSIACPKCRAKPGEKCKGANGNGPRETSHEEREWAFFDA